MISRRGLAISLGGFPGAAAALSALADATGRLHSVTLDRDRPPTDVNVRMARALMSGGDLRLVVFGGWSAAYRPWLAAAHRRRIAAAVYWTSTPGQTDIGHEVDRLGAMLDDPRIDHHWFADRTMADALGRRMRRCAWLPIVLAPASLAPRAPRRPAGDVAAISLFCSPHEYGRKNVLASLLALSRVSRRFHLHVNGLSTHPHYRSILDRLGLPFIEHGWMDRRTYLDTVGGLDLGLQVSLAESYNYVAADHLLAGVPVVVSPAVPVVADLPAAVARPFVVCRPSDPFAIATTIAALLSAPAATARRVAVARERIVADQKTRTQIAGHVIARAMRHR